MKRTRKLPTPTKIKLELTKETIRGVSDTALQDVAGGGNTHKPCSVAPWCPAHTC